MSLSFIGLWDYPLVSFIDFLLYQDFYVCGDFVFEKEAWVAWDFPWGHRTLVFESRLLFFFIRA